LELNKRLFFLTLIGLSFFAYSCKKIANLEATAQAFLMAVQAVQPTQAGVPIADLDTTARAASMATQAVQPTQAIVPTLAFTPTSLVNQTTHGHILRDEHWKGKIHIIGDILVDEGVTLTIEPGTVVRIAANQDADNLFDAPFDMKIGIQSEVKNINGVHFGEPYRDDGHHISIRIAGTLQAVGTPEQMITITSDSPNPGIYDWNHFEFAHGILSYSVVEYYRVIGPGDGTEVSHNILQYIGECGVCANSSVVVEYNTISYAGHELIDMHQSSPIIRNNSLGPNPEHAGIIIDGGSPQILNNTIKGCGVGIGFISPPGKPNLEGNIFINNGQDITYD
jgi:hypothetical protein